MSSVRTVSSDANATAALPWPALLTIGAATLVMVTAEMLPTAVLTPMSVGLGVSEGRTGHLVSVWALTVVIVSLPLVRLTARIGRRELISIGLLGLAASAALTALAPTYATVLAARLLGAASVGLLWATANAHVADLVSQEHLGRAVSVVLGGATLGMVVGTPLARLVADAAGWRAAFAGLAAAAAAMAGVVRATVPAVPRRTHTRGSAAGGVGGLGGAALRPVLVLIGLVALILVGHYGAYTFITRLTEPFADALPGGASALLLVFGVASAAGVVAAGSAVRTVVNPLVAASALTAVALAALVGADSAPLGVTVVVVWGFGSGALPALAQTAILTQAGERHRDLASALIPAVFNGGIAIGAALASGLVDATDVSAVPLPAAAIVALGTAGLAARTTTRAPHASRVECAA